MGDSIPAQLDDKDFSTQELPVIPVQIVPVKACISYIQDRDVEVLLEFTFIRT